MVKFNGYSLVSALALAVAACGDGTDGGEAPVAQEVQPPDRQVDPESGSEPIDRAEDPVADPSGDPLEDGVDPPADDPPVNDSDLSITRIDVPDEVFAQTHALSETSWVLNRPSPSCDASTGVLVAANVYELVNEGSETADVSVGIRTAHEGVSLTLTGGTLFSYESGILPGSTASCLGVGTPSDTFGSELSDLSIPGGSSLDLVVAGIDESARGSYQVTIIRQGIPDETPPDVTPDPDPELEPPPGADPMHPSEYYEGCTDECAFAADGACDDGGTGSDSAFCSLGTDCTDCGYRAGTGGTPDPPPGGGGCDDSCLFALDGMCDDGGPGSITSLCLLGTDCFDCGPRSGGGGGGTCTDTCPFAADGECDDGGPGSLYSLCDLGTDCLDCGPR